ncbi:hypothetical protein FBQ82_07305 [Anaerolineae bacterium CFX7]|nr:hypothetical protein [Anaerolineae bacterium CFX7]
MKLVYAHNAQTYTLALERAGDNFEIEIGGERARVQVIAFAPPRLVFSYNGKIFDARVARAGKKHWVYIQGATFALERAELRAARDAAPGAREGAGSDIVVAPMPGQVRGVLVGQGDAVTEGQPLVLMEAMKMELKVNAPHAGVVAKIFVTLGQSVEREQILAEVTKRGG